MNDAIATIEAVEANGMELAVTTRTLEVIDTASYQRGAEMLKTVKQYLRKVSEVLDPIIRAAHAAHKTAVDQKRKLEEPVLQAERVLKGRMEAWDRAERDRLQAEQARFAAEAQEQARLEALVAAETTGDEGAVAALAATEAASPIAFAPPAQEPPKAEGVSYRVAWYAEVTDLAALVRAVAAGQAPLKVLRADETILNQLARSLKEALDLPGVRAVAKRDVAVRV